MEKKKDLLETLIKRAEQSKEDTLKVFSVTTETLGKVEVRVPKIEKLLSFIDDVKETNTTYESKVVDAAIAFESIPDLKGNYKQLSEAYDETDPAMLSFKIFTAADAIGEASDIAEKVLETAGVIKNVVKN